MSNSVIEVAEFCIVYIGDDVVNDPVVKSFNQTMSPVVRVAVARSAKP